MQLSRHLERPRAQRSKRAWSTERKKSKWEASLVWLLDPFEGVPLLLLSNPEKNSPAPTGPQRLSPVPFWKGTRRSHCLGYIRSAGFIVSLLYATPSCPSLHYGTTPWRSGSGFPRAPLVACFLPIWAKA